MHVDYKQNTVISFIFMEKMFVLKKFRTVGIERKTFYKSRACSSTVGINWRNRTACKIKKLARDGR